ncbi:protein PHYTOCHROME KINASE SUBSTRATE 3 [Ziziphus jujuba]|uniref:Protein PHYTOCHROME KINASE SUBSTRATE 3 n=1 Tax=Ziziphus jujuba TaxID=326968 RepID=A0A6P3ZR84_ZIZJJ|nr:protein PHYTOCHROME KINASE SUBSTRATE 3 [Ziziphus jujuba]
MDQNSTDLHDASFSYLRAGEGLEVNNNDYLSGSVEVQQYPSPPLMSLGRTTKTIDQEGEICVFGAERYFNMILNDDINKSSKSGGYKKEINNNSNQVHHHHPPPPQRLTRTKSRPGTPSSCSEVSWNSQAALLPRLNGNPSLNKKKKLLNGKNFFVSTFSCGGSCSDKKSIYVHEEEVRKDDQHQLVQIDRVIPLKPQHQQQQQQRLINVKQKNHEDQHFAFPILNPGAVHTSTADEKLVLQLEGRKKTTIEDEEQLPRKSLEVFGSNTMTGDVVAINLERKLSMLTWDAIPKASNVSSASGTTRMNDDMESDASSDLFEIENISCGTGFQPLFTRQVSDGMSSCMTPTSRYEPSEASIDWSVVTASAAGGQDVSVVRDYDEKMLAANNRSINSIAKTKAGMEKEVQTNRHSGILGCKSHKSVRVAESAYRTKVKD